MNDVFSEKLSHHFPLVAARGFSAFAPVGRPAGGRLREKSPIHERTCVLVCARACRMAQPGTINTDFIDTTGGWKPPLLCVTAL